MDIEQNASQDTAKLAAEAEEFKAQGNEEFKKKNFAKAIEYYTMAIKNKNDEPSYYTNRSACYVNLKKYNKAIEDCDQAIKLNPKFMKAIWRKGTSHAQLAQFAEAVKCFDEALKLEQNAQIKADRAEAAEALEAFKKLDSHCNSDDWPRAIVALNSLISRFPDNTYLQMKQVEIKAKLGNIDEALSLYNTNSRFWDASPIEMQYLRAVTLLYQGRSEDARKVLITCMSLDPDNKKCKDLLKKAKQSEILKEKGNDALKEKRYQECIPIFSDALAVDPSNRKINSLCYSNRGLAKLRVRDFKGAIEDLTKAIELDDKYFKSYMRRAEARQELGEFDMAVGDYNEAQKCGGDASEIRRLIQDCQKKAKLAKRKDYYGILEVPRDADDKAIKKAYKKLAVQWHPDKHVDPAQKELAQKKFKDIGEAYSVLSDPKKKQMFDNGVDPEGQGGMDSEGVDPTTIFSQMFGGGGGGFPFGGGGGFPFGGGGGNVKFTSSGGGGGFPGQPFATFFH